MTPLTPAFAFSQSLRPFFSACQGQNKMHKLLITKIVFNIWLVGSIFLLNSSNPMCNAFSFCHDIYTKSREQDAIKQIFQEHFLPLTIAVCAWTQLWLLTSKTVRKRNDFGVLQGPVVQKWINANPRLKVNQGVYFSSTRCCSTLVFGKTLHYKKSILKNTNKQKKLSPKTWKYETKLYANPGLSQSAFEQPGPELKNKLRQYASSTKQWPKLFVFVHPNPLPQFWATSKLWAPGNAKTWN